MISLLSFERCFGISSFISTPKLPPSIKTKILNTIGLNILEILSLPEFNEIDIEIATLYAIRPNTSSSATTCSKVFTKSPFAPVCLIVITVEAGAVAEASADKTKENGKFKFKI